MTETTNDADLLTKVRDLAAQKLNVGTESLTETATFEALKVDSLGLLELSIILEREFSVEIEDEEMSLKSTVNDLAELLGSKGAEA